MPEPNVASIPTENTSICQHCGVKVKSDVQFCPYCGQTVVITPTKAFCEECGSELNENGICNKCNISVAENDDASLTNIAAYNQSIEGEKNKKSRKKFVWKLILIVLGSLIVISLFTYIYVLPMIYYHQAGSAFERQDYEKAYALYHKLDDYKNSESKIDDCIYRWADYILENGKHIEATTFKNEVLLDSTHYPNIYSSIWSKIDANTKFDYWDDSWNNTKQATTVYTMLQTLPASYEDTSELLKLFKAISEGDVHPVSNYIRENKTFLETVWPIEFIQDFLTSDEMMAYFLEGHWTTYGNGYYLTFYEDADGGTYSNFDLPWVSKPAGTKYYTITSQTYSWADANNKELAKVFKFTVNDFNTISVFCYRNNRTYKLYR